MTRDSCAVRFAKVIEAAPMVKAGTAAVRRKGIVDSLARCVGCDIGAAHAVGKRHPDAPDVERPTLLPTSNESAAAPVPSAAKKTQKKEAVEVARKGHVYQKSCASCGGAFESQGARSKFCSVECSGKTPGAKKLKKRSYAKRKPPSSPQPPPSPTAALRADVVSGARELLEMAGYHVREVSVPAGVALFVDGGA